MGFRKDEKNNAEERDDSSLETKDEAKQKAPKRKA